MTQSRTPPTKPSIPVPRRTPADSVPPQDEIPRGELIDVVSHRPVEPARLQVFPVPEEFRNGVSASKPPRLRPDDVKDTVPRGLPRQRASEPAPPSDSAPITSAQELPRPSAAPNARTLPPRAGTPASGVARTRPSALTRWALTGRIPGRVKIAFGTVLGALLFLLVWENWDTDDGDADDFKGDPTTASAVPLLDAPTAAESQAARVTEAPTVVQPTAAAPDTSPEQAAAESRLPSQPEPVANPVKPVSSDANRTQRAPASVTTPAQKGRPDSSNSAVLAAASAKTTLTPLFVPR